MAKKLTVDEAYRWAHLEGLTCKITYNADSECCMLDVVNADGDPIGPIWEVRKGVLDANGFPQDAEKEFGEIMEQHGRPQSQPPQLTLVK